MPDDASRAGEVSIEFVQKPPSPSPDSKAPPLAA
jgi:hypothetical protein